MTRISVPLTWTNLRDLRRKGQLLGFWEVTVNQDESFEIYDTQAIVPGESNAQGYTLNGGARGSYYLRRFRKMDSFNPPEIDLGTSRDKSKIGLRVYSNSTLPHYRNNIPYSTAIVFPSRQTSQGLRELLELIRTTSSAGILKEVSDRKFEELLAFVLEDLKTGKHTRERIAKGAELDMLFC